MADRKQEMMAAENARDILAVQFLNNPDVSQIDIGSDREAPSGPPFPLVLRLHFKSEAARRSATIPQEVDGIPVRSLVANYEAQ